MLKEGLIMRISPAILTVSGAILLVTTPIYAQTVNVKINGVDTAHSGHIMVMMFTRDGFSIKHEKALQTRYVPSKQSHFLYPD